MLFTAPPFRPIDNESHFESQEYVSLVESAQREAETRQRLDLYRQITRFLKEQAFVLPVAGRVAPHAMRANVHGVTSTGAAPDMPLLETVWID